MRAIALLIALFVAPLAFPIDAAISVRPADPTSAERVSLVASFYGSCPPNPLVTRTGYTIAVTLDPGPCLSPPFLVTQSADLGILPAGSYTVVDGTGGEGFRHSFVVRDANTGVTVHPAIGRISGGDVIDVIAEVGHCGTSACGPPVITIDGVMVPVTVVNRTTFRVQVPAHAAGPVEVIVTNGTNIRRSFAYRYYDPAAAPVPELFDRVLLPVFYNGPGVNGARWSTEFAIRNENGYRVDFLRGPDQVPSIAAGAIQRAGFEAAPGGVFLVVPRGAADNMRFNAMIRDNSREFEAWGTEIPVVRERDFATAITLLNVPAYPGFRTMLRVYSLQSTPQIASVTVISMDDGRTLSERSHVLQSPAPCNTVDCFTGRPAYVAIPAFTESLPGAMAQERLAVRVQSIAPVWAFLTITNNESQHVTTISPQ